MSEAQSVWAMNCSRKDEDRNLEYDKTKLVGCSLYLISYMSLCPFSMCLTGMENDFYWCASKAKRVNLKLNRCTSLARLNKLRKLQSVGDDTRSIFFLHQKRYSFEFLVKMFYCKMINFSEKFPCFTLIVQ